MEDIEDNVLITQCRNRFIDDNQLNYCIVEVTNKTIDEINKVSSLFSKRKVDANLNVLIGSGIYLILGGGIRVIRDRENVNTNLNEKDWNLLLHEINCLS